MSPLWTRARPHGESGAGSDVKPYASLSLDLDDKWSYMKTAGCKEWQVLPSYLDIVVPRILEFLADANLTITVFLVGQDAALARNRELLAAIPAAGHEIGNHSFRHEPWLHLYEDQALEAELSKAEEYIERATGKRPFGFRGPGFTVCFRLLRLLVDRGYLYDASVLPTFVGPLARAFFFKRTQLSPEEKQERRDLYGNFKDGLLSLHPHRWSTPAGCLFEIPITTMPLLRTPVHVSYLLYLSEYSIELALWYFRRAIRLWRLLGVHPSLLLHPLDFLGGDDVRDLSFFPSMTLSRESKLVVVTEVLRLFRENFTVLTLERHVREIAQVPDLPVKGLEIDPG